MSGRYGVHNQLSGTVAHGIVQANTIHGDVHFNPAAPKRGIPLQLPAAPWVFSGRSSELDALTNALGSTTDRPAPAAISVISGAGGIGKTSLALRWAHLNADSFPDGQLFVDLRGFAPSGTPMPPAVAVRGFLDALGVEPAAIPMGIDGQGALYRSLVAGRRILIVLDNARDASQVAPLLPGSANCTVLVTSRDRLAGLVIAHGARPVAVDVLDEQQAQDLLAHRLGQQRLAAEPQDVVDKLITYCGGSPLALSIVASRAALEPQMPLEVLTTELEESANRLDALDEGDPAISPRAVLSWSYAALTSEQATVFRLLGVVPGQDISLPAAAHLTGLTRRQTKAHLKALERVSLVQQHRPGRYTMHDFIRLYAAEQAHQFHEDCELELKRLVEFYLHTAHAADQRIKPGRTQFEIAPAASGSASETLRDDATAWTWLDTEHHCLLEIQQLALNRGWHTAVWQVAWTLATFHYRRGHRHDQLAAWRAALTAADELREPAVQARVRRALGNACTRVDRSAEAIGHLQQGLALTSDIGERSNIHRALAWAWGQQGNYQQALEHAGEALELVQTIQGSDEEAPALNLVGYFHARLGHHEQAHANCEAALTLFRRGNERLGEAHTLDSLGYIAHHSGDHSQAIKCFEQALMRFQELNHTYAESDVLDRLGQAHTAMGTHDQARHSWQLALTLYHKQYRTGDADRVQQQLAARDEPTRTAEGPSSG
ncbi:tetratricopeptide repeat protein [Saccharopolyspora aridisoli]|uniref:Tetratricopeptide repeat protein n=1 Tax=Saccharopolyspora aridisoli TaxID=2530385 RepID=A0A4R4UPH9_9PSEU|nr:tetratricopeptide repeat protein [Saccharopolyspora aridisoli]TDC94138.1 tetratricopeptide repeat protein [Saccharopolyspora aridisoli]